MKLSKPLSPLLSLYAVGLMLVGSAAPSAGFDLDINDNDSIISGMDLLAHGLMDYYEGTKYGGTVGMFSWPYYWWEAGAAWGSMLNHWYYTGNDTYVPLIKEALIYQTGENFNYMPSNQTTTEGNDDQGFWGIAAMQAAEYNFSNPTGKDEVGWLYLAQAVFNTMTTRWDTVHCNGGLRWQIFTWNSGYDYKNTVSNGCMFNLAARLARYTGNNTYLDWAEKIWDWTVESNFINTTNWEVYDGADILDNCAKITKLQWTYNLGLYASGAAFVYNYTEPFNTSQSDIWLGRINSLVKTMDTFFQSDGIMYEAACQPSGVCNTDQRSFKAIFSRFMANVAILVPQTEETIMSYFKTTAPGIAKSCSGGTDGHTCGLNWNLGEWDGKYGLGEQMCALEAMSVLLIDTKPGYLTNDTGGTSVGDSTGSAGLSGANLDTGSNSLTITQKDKIGAGFLTAVVIGYFLALTWFLLV
ncbi:mannan endo-1,6-alpha-mannosidase [Nadsonia fulvescens var. elongata DSM 6958]|uniref:Mannan endo-1,6-alpha-mannosidase n=1 Tax=Nadsonia fulvescens var. elongata DSM 6958 TaxID=857566 RepID=A0A1E3PLU4_9ASCO|nr:mannan endo-1,6-alpha-mannosidase [Nadsonia fulvescens var. elongata DSM 6958]